MAQRCSCFRAGADGPVGLAEVQHVGVELPASAAESFTQTMFWCSMAVVRASSSTSSSASRGMSFSRICTMSTPPAKAA